MGMEMEMEMETGAATDDRHFHQHHEHVMTGAMVHKFCFFVSGFRQSLFWLVCVRVCVQMPLGRHWRTHRRAAC